MTSLQQSPWRWVSALLCCSLLASCQSMPLLSLSGIDNEAILTTNSPFKRLSSTTICSQSSCEDSKITSAEIIAATPDGMILVYTDSPRNSIGFLDINDPAQPVGLGRLELIGEPTSIAIKGNLALVSVTTSSNEIHTGELIIVDILAQSKVHQFELPGQPDSIAISPDKNYAAIAIENERSFDINGGRLPQAPAGEVVALDISADNPFDWQLTRVTITGLAEQYSTDPEPEYVDINSNNHAVVTLQENNHIVLIDLPTAVVINDFTAGSTTSQIPADTSVSRFDLQVSAPREPDGVSWLDDRYIVTADEGDYYGGTDTVSIFDRQGNEVWTSGDDVRRVIRAIGRQEQTLKNGAQPENIEVARFANSKTYLFANIERGDIAMVYDATQPDAPSLVQVLDTPKGPEGGLAIPSRGLFIVASEDDEPGSDNRAQIHIFELVTSN